MRKAGPADAFGEIAGVKAKIDGLLLDPLGDFGGDFAGPLHLFLVRIDFVFDERADGGDDHLLLIG